VQSFIKMVQNQFHITPKFFRFDNDLEFMLSTFYNSLGIIHQQNGRVERKHQHILNVGRAFLFQSKLPPSFWSYEILYVVFFINRITTSLLNHKSPFRVLSINYLTFIFLRFSVVYAMLPLCKLT